MPLDRPKDALVRSIYTSYLNYDGPEVDFPVSLFNAEESIERWGSRSLRWSGHLKAGYDLFVIPGGHSSLFTGNHVPVVGRAISGGIERADARFVLEAELALREPRPETDALSPVAASIGATPPGA